MFLMRFLIPVTILIFTKATFAIGTFQAVIFKDGIPAGGENLVLNGNKVVTSDNDGLIEVELEEGRHFFEMKKGEEVESVSFVVVDDETTQVLVNKFSSEENQGSKALVSEPELPQKIDANAPKGTLSGVVRDENGKTLKGAKVFITGVSQNLVTDKNGRFKIEVPEGRYSVSILHKAYSTQTLPNQTVLASKDKALKIQMMPAGLELEEFVVVAPHVKGSLASLIEVRRKASTVADVLGAEQMSKSGDSNAASSLARVTGLTVVDGRFVYIRGLGERYSNVLLNGTTLPSPDPTRRVVQLDLFPSGILESMVIQKSYGPNLPGNFGGGAVNLKTKDIPEKFQAKISLSTTYQDQQGEIDSYAGGSRDWLGFDDGSRALPASIAEATANGQRIGVNDPRTVDFGLAFKRNYSTQKKTTRPVPGLSMSIGNTLRYRGKKFGFNLAGMYGDRYNYNEVERTSFNAESSDSQLSVDGRSTNRRSRRDINLSGMLNLGMDLGPYADIRSNTLLLRKSVDRVERRVFSDQDNTFDDTTIEWQERQLFTQMLSGTHQIGSNKKRLFKWRGNYSNATMDQPDSRTFRIVTDEGTAPRLETQPRTTERTFGLVEDQVREGEVSFEIPVVDTKNFTFLSKVGAGQMNKERNSRFQRFGYEINPDVAGSITGNPSATNLDQVCTDAVIRSGACTLRDTTQPNDRFEAEQELRSYFVDTDTKLFERVRLNLGMRFEDSTQTVATFQGEQLVRIENTLIMQDFLPAAGMTFFLSDNLQFRLGYSETISRPAFKDLSPQYYDDERDRTIQGNAELSGTIITNRDARLEWYFGNQENISVGYFDKEFINPIEEVAGSFQNGRLTYSEGGFQLANVGNARVRGFEVEFRKNFGFISDFLQPLAFGGNYARIESEMSIFSELASQVTNIERPLQGQSPYVVNLNLDYDNKDTGTNATILFNVFGRRIDTVGTDRRPDTYQEAFNQLDFVFSQTFGEEQRNKVRFKVQNILNPDAVLKIGDEVAETYKKGRRAGISFTRTF